ncbi:MAG: transcriptional repressor, partial [Kiloniellales bacterium]
MMSSERPALPFDAKKHDHSQCVADALRSAESLCERSGARLTSLRRRVLELVWTSHAPVGAYELLDRLSHERA